MMRLRIFPQLPSKMNRNGGARDLLAPKGIAILYSETDRALMHQLGLQFGFREFLSVQAKSDDHYRILKAAGHID